MRPSAALVALVLSGCAMWSPSPSPGANLVSRADRLAADGDLDGALRAYDAALAEGAAGDAAVRARAGRATVTAAQAAAADLARVRGELASLQELIAVRESEVSRLTRELAEREGELTKARHDLSARQAELTKAQHDLSARQAELSKLGVEADKLRGDLEDLKRIEMQLERRRP